MIPINRTYAPIQAFADELVRCGVEHAVTSPGSRNAPLILSLASHPGLSAVSVLDERSAGFTALGIAKASGRPVAVTCTSGTAAANLLPAVVEARESRVPLVVLTADRPPELRDVGAGQAIDQLKLYGSFVKWFAEVGNLEPGPESNAHHRSLACRAFYTAAGGRPGPVHLNFPLRDPLAPEPEDLDDEPWRGRPDGRPWVEVLETEPEPSRTIVEELAREVAGAPRGALVCGPWLEDIAEPAARLAAAAGWPLLAEPTSGLRCGDHDRSHVIAHYDVLLRSERFVGDHPLDLALRIGDTPTSKPLRAFLAESRQIVVDPHMSWHEPTRRAEQLVSADPAALCDLVSEALEQRRPRAPDPEWLGSWLAADILIPPALAHTPDPFEPKVYAALAELLPQDALVWVSSSMPIRDVETFFPQTERRLRFLANRGANGIDGVVSSALGSALASDRRCFLFTGELALLHDLGGLVALGSNGAELTIVCVNNSGGRIFDFLPVAEHADPALYEEHVLTPRGVDLERAAALAGIPHTLAATADELRDAIGRPGLIEARVDHERNVELHREVFATVDRALGA